MRAPVHKSVPKLVCRNKSPQLVITRLGGYSVVAAFIAGVGCLICNGALVLSDEDVDFVRNFVSEFCAGAQIFVGVIFGTRVVALLYGFAILSGENTSVCGTLLAACIMAVFPYGFYKLDAKNRKCYNVIKLK